MPQRFVLLSQHWDLLVRYILTTSDISSEHSEITIALRISDLRMCARGLHLMILVLTAAFIEEVGNSFSLIPDSLHVLLLHRHHLLLLTALPQRDALR